MARIIKKERKKEHGNRSFQKQVWYSASFNLWSFRLEYLELVRSICCKLRFVRFLTQRPINLPNIKKKRDHMRDI
jgi:hypothetical protein